jgi:hypothetical protein
MKLLSRAVLFFCLTLGAVQSLGFDGADDEKLTGEELEQQNVMYFLLRNLLDTLGKAPKEPKEPLLELAQSALVPLVPIYIERGTQKIRMAEFRRAIVDKQAGKIGIVVILGKHFDKYYFNDPVGVEARILRRLVQLAGSNRELTSIPDSAPAKSPQAWEVMGYYLSIAPKDRSADTQETRDLITAFTKDGRAHGPEWTAALSRLSDLYDIDYDFTHEIEAFRVPFLANFKKEKAHEIYAFLNKALDRVRAAAERLVKASEVAIPDEKSPEFAKLSQDDAILRTYLRLSEELENQVMDWLHPFPQAFIDDGERWRRNVIPLREARAILLEKPAFEAAFLQGSLPPPELTPVGQKTSGDYAAWLQSFAKPAPAAAPTK